MKRICRWILAVCLIVMCLTGCWDRRELSDLGIQLGTGFDKIGDNYQVSVQVVNPSAVSTKNGNGSRSPVVMYKASAPTLFEAFRKLTLTSPRKIYGAHIRVLVIGEALAREGISKILDFQTRVSEPRPDLFVMIAKNDTAENVLKIMTPLEEIPAVNMYSSLEASSKVWATTADVTLDKLVNQLITDGINPVLTGINVIGNQRTGEKEQNVKEIDSTARLKYSNLGVFKGDRLIGWLNPEETKGFNYIMNNINTTVNRVACPDGGNLTIEVYNSKTSTKSQIKQGKTLMNINVNITADIGEVECDIDLTSPSVINQLQKQAEKEIKQQMEQTMAHVQGKYKSDIFGFGQVIYHSHPKKWNQLKKDWDEEFPRVKVNYQVKVIIRKLGAIGNPITKELKE